MRTSSNTVTSLLATCIAASVVVSSVRPAWALTDEEAAKVEKLVEAGTTAYKAGELLDAVEAFKEAFEISGDPRIGYNYGRALENAGFCGRATAQFEALAGKSTNDKKVRELAEKKVSGDLQCTPMGVVVFDCNDVQPTKLTLAGKPVSCGEPVRLLTTQATWSARATGYLPKTEQVVPVEGETTTVRLALEPLPPPPPPSKPWKLVAGGATAGLGAGLIVVGLVSDATANERSEQILDASSDGDLDRLDRLEEAGRSARTRSLILTASGATLAAVGGVLLYLHFTDDSGERSLTVAPGVGPDSASVHARFRW
jgi:hypothetical protein